MKYILLAILATTISLTSCSQTRETINHENTNYDSLRTVLEKMRDEDQEIRRILMDSIGFNSPNAGPFIQKMINIDMENQKNIKVILEKYGWIAQSKIGQKAAEAFFYTVQHSNPEFVEQYLPEFKNLSEQGEANPRQCAMMEDRLLMWKGKKQLYGTQASDFRPDKKMAIWPIEDPSNVNERRKKVGFTTTVEEYASEMGVLFERDAILPTEIMIIK